MSRSKSDLSCDAIENLGGLLRLALLGLFLGREVGRAEVALLRLALLGLLLGREVGRAEVALLRLVLVLFLLLPRAVSFLPLFCSLASLLVRAPALSPFFLFFFLRFVLFFIL